MFSKWKPQTKNKCYEKIRCFGNGGLQGGTNRQCLIDGVLTIVGTGLGAATGIGLFTGGINTLIAIPIAINCWRS